MGEGDGRTGLAESLRRAGAVPDGQLGRIAGYLRERRRHLVVAAVISAVRAALGLAPALVIRQLIDDLQHNRGGFATIAVVVAVGVAAVLFGGLVGVVQTWLTLRISKGVVADLRTEVFDALLGQSVGYHTRSRAGELVSRILNDIGSIDNVLGPNLLRLATSGCAVVASLTLMVALSWQLALLTLLTFPVVAVLLRLASRSIYYRGQALQAQLGVLTAHLQEILGPSGITLVKSLGREPHERSRFAATNDDLRRVEVASGMAGQWLQLALTGLQLLGPALLVLAGAELVARGTIALGTLVGFATVAALGFAAGLQGLATSLTAVITSLPAWARVFAVLDEPQEVPERPRARHLSAPAGSVRLDRVTFAYPGALRPSLRDVSAVAEPGELVAVVGPSGAGKSTLAGLVARFHDPQSGRVLLDGHDLRDLRLASVSAAVSVVLQETYLFHAPLRDNLLYGRPDATGAELRAAIHAAHLDEVVAGLPDGLDTVVGERGHRLSGGERQRVAIARTLVKDPRVLILDEATSHLDPGSEEAIQAALARLLTDRTSIVIAHRLSTVRRADLLVVLDRGQVVETGSHAELVGAGGLYADLVARQLDPQGLR